MKDQGEFEVPGETPAWLQGVGLGLLFAIVIFGDAIMMWLS